MKFLAALLFISLISLFAYYIYEETPARPQIDLAMQNIQDLVRVAGDSINTQIGYSGSGGAAPQNITVSVPKREAQDWQPVGKMGHDILNKPLQVEIVAAQDAKPSSTQLTVISSVLSHYSGHTPKLLIDNTTVPQESNYTAQQIIELTKSKRTCYSDSGKVCLFILFLPGTFESSHTLGVAFTSTSAIFMQDQFQKASNPVVTADRISEATVTHELGHLFGLVNLTSRSPRNHEDPSHPGHSSNPNSVMYWAVEDLSINAILTGGPPNSFDAEDEADLADIKASQL